jgi:hypothetical protein
MPNPIATGALPPRNSSSVSEPALFSVNREWFFLIFIGLLGVLAHVSVHLPLKMPGHHGLEWMALLMFARVLGHSPWAATIAATSAAGFSCLPVWGFHETTIGLSYLLSGWVVDGCYRVIKSRGISVLALIAALAHVVKPLWKWAAAAGFGVHFGSIEAGVGFAVVSHLMFGLVGGAAGAFAGRALKARLRGDDPIDDRQ